MKKDKLYSIYKFTDPRNQAVIYVGLTNDPARRYREHTSKGGILYSIAQELASEGLQLIFDILEASIQSKADASAREEYWIRYHTIQGHRLINIAYNTAALARVEEDRRLKETITEKFSYLPEDKVNYLAEMIMKDIELVGFDAWQLNFNAVGLTLRHLTKNGLLTKKMDEIDAAKITFDMFGYNWVDDDEVEE